MNAPPAATSWTQRPERGTPGMLRFIVWVSLALGRAPARVLLRIIAAYFLSLIHI